MDAGNVAGRIPGIGRLHVVREADRAARRRPRPRPGRRGRPAAAPGGSRGAAAGVDGQGAEDLTRREYPAVSRATERGNRRCAPAARAMVLTPMKVAPNRTAETSAAARPADQGGQGDARRLDDQRGEQQAGARPATPQPRPQRRGRYGGHTDQHPGAGAQPAGGALPDRGDQECAGDDVADALQGVAANSAPNQRCVRAWRRSPRVGRRRPPGPTRPPAAGSTQAAESSAASDGRRPPRGPPVGEPPQHQDQQAGQRDAGAHPAERPAGQVRRVCPQSRARSELAATTNTRALATPGDQAQHAPHRGAVGERHRGQASRSA